MIKHIESGIGGKGLGFPFLKEIKNIALKFQIKGIVFTKPDGSIKIIAEGIFGVLKTFIRRMYHHVTMAKLESVVREFCCRFSHPEMFDSPYEYLLITLRLVPTR